RGGCGQSPLRGAGTLAVVIRPSAQRFAASGTSVRPERRRGIPHGPILQGAVLGVRIGRQLPSLIRRVQQPELERPAAHAELHRSEPIAARTRAHGERGGTDRWSLPFARITAYVPSFVRITITPLTASVP